MAKMPTKEWLYYHYLKQFHPLGQDAIDNPWMLDLWMRDEIGPRMKKPEDSSQDSDCSGSTFQKLREQDETKWQK